MLFDLNVQVWARVFDLPPCLDFTLNIYFNDISLHEFLITLKSTGLNEANPSTVIHLLSLRTYFNNAPHGIVIHEWESQPVMCTAFHNSLTKFVYVSKEALFTCSFFSVESK